MRRRISAGLLGTLAFVGFAVIFTECTTVDHTAPKSSASAPLSPAQAQMVVSKSMLQHTPARFRWVAQAHTDAMQEVLAQAPRIRKMNAGQKCAALANIVRHQFAAIEANTGVKVGASYETALARALSRINCASPQALSIWTAGSSISTVHMDPTYADYSGALEAAFQNTTTPDQTAANLDAVVVSATDLSSAQADTLAALASLGASSAYYWYDVQTSNGYSGDYGGDISVPLEESMFMPECGSWCKIGWVDVLGALGGAIEGAFVGSVIGAIVGSGSAYLMM